MQHDGGVGVGIVQHPIPLPRRYLGPQPVDLRLRLCTSQRALTGELTASRCVMTSARDYESASLVIGDADLVTLPSEAGETGGGDLFLATSSALAFGIGFHFTLDWSGLQTQALAAVRAVLGRARFPASWQSCFGVSPPASEARRIESPGESQEQDGKQK